MKQFFLPFVFLFCITARPPAAAGPAFRMERAVEQHRLFIHHRLLFVEARIDDRQGLFLLDTGVASLMLNERHFPKGYPGRGQFLDVNGVRHPLQEMYVEEFTWGGLHRERFFTPLIALERLERVVGFTVLGLIGHEVIRDVEMLIDYDAGRLTLYRLDEDGAGPGMDRGRPDHVLPFTLEQHVPVIDVRLPGSSRPFRLGVDSGASFNVLDDNWRKKLLPHALRVYHVLYSAALSARRVPYLTLGEAHLGGELSLLHFKVAFPNLNNLHENLLLVDGFLGVDLFRLGVVSVNYRRQRFAIWINENVFTLRYRSLRSEAPGTG